MLHGEHLCTNSYKHVAYNILKVCLKLETEI